MAPSLCKVVQTMCCSNTGGTECRPAPCFGAHRLGYPKPKSLPSTRRINITHPSRPRAEQPDEGGLFSLPRELRDCIYEHALGGRRVRLLLRDGPTSKRRHLASVCVGREGQPDPLCVALLRACRQAYLEAKEILLCHNAFTLDVDDLKTCVYAGLGMHTLPFMRAVCINFNAFPLGRWLFDGPDADARVLLQRMKRVRRLEVHFTQQSSLMEWPSRVAYDPREIQQSAWGKLICGLPALEEFRIGFTRGGKVVDVSAGDRRWGELERNIQACLASGYTIPAFALR